MNKWRILPQLAWTGITKNGTVYYPYIGAGIFSVFTYFIFSSIIYNDLIATLPNSSYAWMLLRLGRGILLLILIPFLAYTNSFLTKRRKKEIGLYNVLGLEKRHIGSMLFMEAIFVFIMVMAGGIISGTVFSKLLFLLLLRMTGLPITVEFVFYPSAFIDTVKSFLLIYGFNLVCNLLEMRKAKPVELLSGSKKGEKEPKLLWIWAVLGIAVLGGGYSVAIRSKIDDMIFMNFFLAVILVTAGTYFLFTSGSVAFLKMLKRKAGVYYKASNFITISGMLYRMKKNAASLVNICIFSTMVMITLLCTASLYRGLDGISDFDYPYDGEAHFRNSNIEEKEITEELTRLSEKYGVTVKRADVYNMIPLSCGKEAGTNAFSLPFGRERNRENFSVKLISADDYNKLQDKEIELSDDQILFYSSGADFEFHTLQLMGKEFQIQEEVKEFYPAPKATLNTFFLEYYMIVKDKEAQEEVIRLWAEANNVAEVDKFIESKSRIAGIKLEGEEEAMEKLSKKFEVWSSRQQGFDAYLNNFKGRAMNESMNGGLLFIGILFSLIFFMCLILIMYYKQISEGYEDKESFVIMQQVGMSDKEIKSTVHRQIRLVFFLPLTGAILHTIVGFFLVEQLLCTLRLFNRSIIISSAVISALAFVVFYGISYLMTAKTYYRIVKTGN